MKCAKCQTENPADKPFCFTCGARLSKAGPSQLGGIAASSKIVASGRAPSGANETSSQALGDVGLVKDSEITNRTDIRTKSKSETTNIGSVNVTHQHRSPSRTVLVECPKCGFRNPERETFRCRLCGLNYVCRKHFDEDENCCAFCVKELRRCGEPSGKPQDERVPAQDVAVPEGPGGGEKELPESAESARRNPSGNVIVNQQTTVTTGGGWMVVAAFSVAVVVILSMVWQWSSSGETREVSRGTDQGIPVVAVSSWARFDQLVKRADYGISLGADRSSYKVGSSLHLNSRIERDGYLNIISISASDGSPVLLFPNRFQEGNRVRAGLTVEVPSSNSGANESLKAMLNPGEEGDEILLVAIHTEQPLNLYRQGSRGSEVFREVILDGPGNALTALDAGRVRFGAGSTEVRIVR